MGDSGPWPVYAASTVRRWAHWLWLFLTARSLPSSPALSELSPGCASYLALTALQGPLMEWYTSIINLTVAAVLLVILVASRRWRDE